jgi:hypothetical protein
MQASVNQTAAGREKAPIWMVAVLLLVLLGLIAFIAYELKGRQGRRPAPSAQSDEGYTEVLGRIDRNLGDISRKTGEAKPLKIQETLAGRPEVAVEVLTNQVALPVVEKDAALVLTGVVWNDKNPLAMLNGRLVGAGEQIDGLKVVEIAKDVVTVEDGRGNRRTVALYDEAKP